MSKYPEQEMTASSKMAGDVVSIVVELGGQQGHYIVDNGYRALSFRDLPKTIVKVLRARIMRSMAGMFGQEMTGIEIAPPSVKTMDELEYVLAQWSKAKIVFDTDKDTYRVVSENTRAKTAHTDCPTCGEMLDDDDTEWLGEDESGTGWTLVNAVCGFCGYYKSYQISEKGKIKGVVVRNHGRLKAASRSTKCVDCDKELDMSKPKLMRENEDGAGYLCLECAKGRKKNATEGMKSRRAMYWCAPDRTYRLTQQEQDAGAANCPKCKIPMEVEPFTRSDKLMICPSCRFKVPTSKAVKKVEVKVPEGVSVQVTQVDETGEDVNGGRVMTGRRGTRIAAEILAEDVAGDIVRLPQMKLDEIAYMVMKDWKNVYFGAKPYLQAMATMRDIKENYGMDSGTSIVAYLLSNMTSYRGEVAKAVKKELNNRLKRAN